MADKSSPYGVLKGTVTGHLRDADDDHYQILVTRELLDGTVNLTLTARPRGALSRRRTRQAAAAEFHAMNARERRSR